MSVCFFKGKNRSTVAGIRIKGDTELETEEGRGRGEEGCLMRNVVGGVEILIHFLLISLQPFPAVLRLYTFPFLCPFTYCAFFSSVLSIQPAEYGLPHHQFKTVLLKHVQHGTWDILDFRHTYHDHLKIITCFLYPQKIFNILSGPSSSSCFLPSLISYFLILVLYPTTCHFV